MIEENILIKERLKNIRIFFSGSGNIEIPEQFQNVHRFYLNFATLFSRLGKYPGKKQLGHRWGTYIKRFLNSNLPNEY